MPPTFESYIHARYRYIWSQIYISKNNHEIYSLEDVKEHYRHYLKKLHRR